MALWMLNWVFLAAVGLVLESMISLLTKEFIPCEFMIHRFNLTATPARITLKPSMQSSSLSGSS